MTNTRNSDLALRSNPKPNIYLDCDGVLADFDGAAIEILGRHPRDFEERFGTERFWKELQQAADFYANLPLLADARELFEGTQRLSPILLTGCPEGNWAEAQKIAWAARHFPGTKIITCRSAEKSQYAKPGDILVDDYPRYRSLWEDAGGIFILHTSADQSLRELGEVLGKPFNE